MSGAWRRLRPHSLRAHLLAPIWKRIPEKQRWTVVHWLNKSTHYCWCDLVDAALCWHNDDSCDTALPTHSGKNDRCKTVCDWSHPDHFGEHDCSCYCGKFQFLAPEGAINREARR